MVSVLQEIERRRMEGESWLSQTEIAEGYGLILRVLCSFDYIVGSFMPSKQKNIS